MAAGKSSVAQAVAERLEPSMHLRGDGFRRMIVNGRAEMNANSDEQALQQLMLRYKAARETAILYSDAGFNVVYQDIIIGPLLNDVDALYQGCPLYLVVLSPRPEAVVKRESARVKSGYGGFTVEQLQTIFTQTPRLGLWLDNSEQSVDETADSVIKNFQGAQISW